MVRDQHMKVLSISTGNTRRCIKQVRRLAISGVAVALAMIGPAAAGLDGNAALAVGLQAQQEQGAPATPAPATTSAENPFYRIQKEDVLDIFVLERPEYSKTQEVLPDGTISYPRLGQFKVEGMTLKELEQRIFKKLDEDLFVNPQVSVSVRQRRVRQVSVVGDGVRAPGKMAMRDGWRVLDVLASAGGLVTNRTEFLTARLLQPKEGRVIPIDLKKLMANDASQNLLLEADDVLTIEAKPQAETQVQVVGQVNKPGAFVFPEDASVIRLLTEAGGPTQTAKLSEASIERNGETIKIDLREPYRTGTDPKDVVLQPGDRLVIPENKEFYYVLGAVGRPGMLPYPDDRKLTVGSVLTESVVDVRNAEYKRTQLMEKQEDGTAKVTVVDGEKLLDKADFSIDAPVKPGDVVYVPFKKGRTNFWQYTGFLNAIPSIRWLFNGQLF